MQTGQHQVLPSVLEGLKARQDHVHLGSLLLIIQTSHRQKYTDYAELNMTLWRYIVIYLLKQLKQLDMFHMSHNALHAHLGPQGDLEGLSFLGVLGLRL